MATTITVTVTVRVVVVAMQGGALLSVGATDRYLVDAINDPVLLVGDTAWSAIGELTTAEMDTYLTDRANRGINCVLVNCPEHYYATNAPNNINDDAPFAGTPFQSDGNNDYMLLADHFIAKAESLGIYVLLDIAYLGYSGSEDGWDTEIAAATTTQMGNWGTYCATRWGGYDNIIWALGGDANPSSYMTRLTACVNGILGVDNRHLITIHNGPDPVTAADNTSDPSWLVLNNIYGDWTDIATLADTAYARSPTAPFFLIEGYYEDHRATDQQGRMQNYNTILTGGCGFVFGNDPIWYFAYSGGDWVAALSSQGSQDTGRAGAFFNSFDWHTLVPDSGHDLITIGYGTSGTADYCGAGINAAGTLAIIYMPSNRTMTVDMSLFAGNVTCRWYDPTNGSYTADAASPHANSGTHEFSRATANSSGDADWLLVLEA